MSDLYVDLTVLRRTERDLDGVAEELRVCARALQEASAQDLGSHQLDRACDAFRETWAYGAKQLGSAAAQVGQQLGEGLRVYAEADAQLASIFAS